MRKDGLVRHHGELYCGCCGILAQPGNEDFDWCDHISGDGCPYNEELADDDDEFYDDEHTND